jgi:hypothetical protein
MATVEEVDFNKVEGDKLRGTAASFEKALEHISASLATTRALAGDAPERFRGELRITTADVEALKRAIEAVLKDAKGGNYPKMNNCVALITAQQDLLSTMKRNAKFVLPS